MSLMSEFWTDPAFLDGLKNVEAADAEVAASEVLGQQGVMRAAPYTGKPGTLPGVGTPDTQRDLSGKHTLPGSPPPPPAAPPPPPSSEAPPPEKPPSREAVERAKHLKQIADYKQPLMRAHPTDGQVFTVEEALSQTHGRVEGKNSELMKMIWRDSLGNQGNPPDAFKYGDRVQVNTDKLHGDQLKKYIEIDKARNPGAYAPETAPHTTPKGASSSQGVQNKANEYDSKVKNLQQKVADHKKKPVTPETSKKIAEERASLLAEEKALMQEGEALVSSIGKSELEAAFKASEVKQVLNIARRGIPVGAAAGAVAAATVTVAMAYFIAQDIRYVLEADNAMEALSRIGERGSNYVVGAAEMGVFKIITGSNAVGAVLLMVVGMCGDSAGACEAQQQAKQEKAEEEQRKEQARLQQLAIARFVEEKFPGTVEIVENAVYVKNQKLWDEIVKQIYAAHKADHAKKLAELYKRAHDLGVKDGKAGEELVHKEEMKSWPEFKENLQWERDEVTRFADLFSRYHEGFKEGNALRARVFSAARELGYRDAKTGSKENMSIMQNWAEVKQLVKEGADMGLLITQLFDQYNDAYDIKTGKKDPYAGLKD